MFNSKLLVCEFQTQVSHLGASFERKIMEALEIRNGRPAINTRNELGASIKLF